jgi:hypothetical protein
MRFGLFTSAPLLLLALNPRGLTASRVIVGGRELMFIAGFTAAFLLFCAANQYGRLQFNTGVRHVVPVTPFLFLLAAGTFVRFSRAAAIALGVGVTYWSWTLAMYRDVERGVGIPECVLRITLEGFRLPWHTTLERLGYLSPGSSPLPVMLIAGALLTALWWRHQPFSESRYPLQRGRDPLALGRHR